MQNNFVTPGCPRKLTFGPWHSTTHGGGALDNSICPKKPISLHFKGQPIDPQIRSDSKKLAKWCSACGSWFCIWLFMVLHPAPALFWAKTELWDLPNNGLQAWQCLCPSMICGLSQVSSSYRPDWSMKPLLLNGRLGFSLDDFSQLPLRQALKNKFQKLEDALEEQMLTWLTGLIKLKCVKFVKCVKCAICKMWKCVKWAMCAISKISEIG